MNYTTIKNIDVEGVVLPNVPLTNIQLVDAVKKLNILNFKGVFSRDELPNKPKRIECGILNIDDSNGRGSHWCSFSKRGKDKLYFDSYGLPPPTELLKYLGGPVYYNSERIQPDNEVFCGHLCLYVSKKTMNDGCKFQKVINDL